MIKRTDALPDLVCLCMLEEGQICFTASSFWGKKRRLLLFNCSWFASFYFWRYTFWRKSLLKLSKPRCLSVKCSWAVDNTSIPCFRQSGSHVYVNDLKSVSVCVCQGKTTENNQAVVNQETEQPSVPVHTGDQTTPSSYTTSTIASWFFTFTPGRISSCVY